MEKYVAKRNCEYNKRIYKVDEILKFTGEVEVCPDCEGKKTEKVCKLCKDSGRIDPPHHFAKLGEEHGKEEKEGEKVLVGEDKYKLAREATKLEIEQTRSEIKRLGGSYNGTWGLERLKMHLIKTQKEYGEKNALAPKMENNA